jgi:hypothetical protein
MKNFYQVKKTEQFFLLSDRMINICESGAKVINLNIKVDKKVNGRLLY